MQAEPPSVRDTASRASEERGNETSHQLSTQCDMVGVSLWAESHEGGPASGTSVAGGQWPDSPTAETLRWSRSGMEASGVGSRGVEVQTGRRGHHPTGPLLVETAISAQHHQLATRQCLWAILGSRCAEGTVQHVDGGFKAVSECAVSTGVP